MQVETPRLLIRKLIESDFDYFHELHSNKNVMDMIPTKPFSLIESKSEMERIFNQNESSKVRIYAIAIKENNEFIGTFAMIKISESEVEIGYRIREKYWNQGFASETTQAMIHYIFENYEVNIISSVVDSRNIGSIKVLEKFLTKSGEEILDDNSIELSFLVKKENCQNQDSRD